MAVAAKIVLAFAMSALAWWLLTDDDCPEGGE
jgi:hypothetical protein